MVPETQEMLLDEPLDLRDCSIEFGRFLANPSPGEELVISGLSGEYPESNNVHEFRDNLFNKVDMVSDDNRRWEPGHPEIPHRTGKVPDVSKFDCGYFGVHYRQAHSSDPMVRKLLETAISAIFDAGLNPSDLEGTNTGVFVGSCFSESEKCWFMDKLIPQSYAITGCERSMIANRVSYFLKLTGPSFICDTACSSSLYALENAYKAIRLGKCDRAIVGGTNLCLHPFVSLQFARLGVLSPDGCCKVFDKKGSGYARSEAVSAIVLQKAKEANRIYCTVLHAKTNCDGYKNSGITYPSGKMQIRLLKEFYQECSYVKPSELSFLEAHGTGTKVGDPEELQAIEDVFLPGRTSPLLIGSVKSNIGHTEPASGLCSITKAIIAIETGLIPPNIHYSEPRPECKVLAEGKLQVITEKTPFKDDKGLIGINSFGFGGGNCHVLLKHNSKTKTNDPRPNDNIHRLVCVSGRTEEAVDTLLSDVMENKLDVEHIRLLHNVFRSNIPGHMHRGFLLASKSGEIVRSSRRASSPRTKLTLCFGDIGGSLNENIGDWLTSPVMSSTIQRIQHCLNSSGLQVLGLLLKQELTIQEQILNNFFLHIALGDLIKACNVQADIIVGINKGLSLGVLAAAYFDQIINLKDAVECALCITWASVQGKIATEVSDISQMIAKGGRATEIMLYENLSKVLKTPRKLTQGGEFSASFLMNSFTAVYTLQTLQNISNKYSTIYEIGKGDIRRLLKLKGHKAEPFCLDTGATFDDFLVSLGRLHECGFALHLHNIYPKVELPVSRGTPMISPKIKWSHENDWWVTLYLCDDQMELEEKSFKITLNDPNYAFINGHMIDGRVLFPATGYLHIVWATLAYVHGLMINDLKVVFENCKFKRACAVQDVIKTELTVMIQRASGRFEIIESGTCVVTGTIRRVFSEEMSPIPFSMGVPKHLSPLMTGKDVYKELRLRGYNYKDIFQGIKSCDNGVQVGEITWSSNWMAFMDSMLQLKIIQEDTRLLYVPTGIQRLFIDPKRHMEMVKSSGVENPDLPVFVSKDTGIIRSGGIEFKGLVARSIPRRKYLASPVLEKYVFVSNYAKLTTEQAVRVNMQLILENVFSIRVKAVELIDEATETEAIPLGEIIHNALADQPLIQPDIIILSKSELDVRNVKVENKKLLTEVECSLVVASKICQRPNVLHLALGSIKEGGFILSREALDFDISSFNNDKLCLLTVFVTDCEQLVMLRKKTTFNTPKVIKVSSEDKEFSWLPKLQSSLEEGVNVIAYAQGEPLNGIMGLVACLRREPGGNNLKLVYVSQPSPEFHPDSSFYKDQLSKNLVVNIYKDGQWGTYRHLLLENTREVPVEHCYLNSLLRGDLTSLRWLEGNLSSDVALESGRVLISVYYASLNFRDVMTASGRINVDSITRNRREQECVQGFEYAGRTQSGKRVFGMTTNGACASLINADIYSTIEIPDHLTMEEAATIPVVYGTNYYALFKCGKMKRGDTVLIHSGTGGIGQAAITLALYFGCTVYTTVGTKEKREFLKKMFPQLSDDNISSSRDTQFEKHIMAQTNGRGVDIVLNSLAEEKLFASVRCLANGGRFVEIGKFDLANDSELQMLLISKGASFHGLMVDSFYDATSFVKFHDFLREGVNKGFIKPLNRTVFKMNQTEEAFRYMGTGKHVGKVMIQIREEEQNTIVPLTKTLFPGLPRYFCDSDKTYIICGGLGGFGLELADWLALRGCKNLILTSRSGIKTGYQAYRISIWKTYGCTIKIATDDITTYEGCLSLIKKANCLGPVHAIFNLAVVLKDALLTNQNEESFRISFGPKAYATEFLDKVSRRYCPQLRDFVVFSSVSCGRGNAGQSNYGMSNSVMERICEERRREGLPALAIEWGAIGDVGLVAELQNDSIEREIGGTLQQRISNCLQVMDILLRQKESAIVSSMIVAEKRAGSGGADNIVEAVANILGVKDIKAISLQATLAEVGMDSMTAVEIKQTLEREYDLFLTAPDIKTMTFAKLVEIQAERDTDLEKGTKKERALMGMDMILRLMGDENTINKPVLPISGQNRPNTMSLPTIVLFPGIEGVITIMEPLYKHLLGDLVGLQYPINIQKDTIQQMAMQVLPIVESKICKSHTFKIVSYSFGGLVALETVSLLEEKGYLGTVFCIDSSPEYMINLSKMLEVESDDKFQVSLLVHLMAMQVSYETISKHVEAMLKLSTFEDRIKLAQQIVGNKTPYSAEHQRAFAISLYKRLRAVREYVPDYKLKSKVVLFKPTLPSFELSDADYGLSKYCENPVEVRVFAGNHASVLENEDMATAINEYFPVKDVVEQGKKLLLDVEKIKIDVPTKM